jgi:hypothetical protein
MFGANLKSGFGSRSLLFVAKEWLLAGPIVPFVRREALIDPGLRSRQNDG